MSESLLAASGLGVVLPDGRTLFTDIDLTVESGEAVVIEGPSGVGKSTLLNVLGGLLTPSVGDVRTGSNHGKAWILQGLNALASRSVLDNATIYSLLDGRSERDARQDAESALEMLGLRPHAHKRAHQLSGGELQRVSVARAISCRRALILADEPTSQLDRENARRVMRCLNDQASSGRGVLIVTHDTESLPAGCRRLRLTERGLG